MNKKCPKSVELIKKHNIFVSLNVGSDEPLEPLALAVVKADSCFRDKARMLDVDLKSGGEKPGWRWGGGNRRVRKVEWITLGRWGERSEQSGEDGRGCGARGRTKNASTRISNSKPQSMVPGLTCCANLRIMAKQHTRRK